MSATKEDLEEKLWEVEKRVVKLEKGLTERWAHVTTDFRCLKEILYKIKLVDKL